MKRRLARIRISFEVLEWILTCKYLDGVGRRITTDAPKDLKILSVYEDRDYHNRCSWMICESSEFDEIDDGELIPVRKPFEYTAENDPDII